MYVQRKTLTYYKVMIENVIRHRYRKNNVYIDDGHLAEMISDHLTVRQMVPEIVARLK